MMIQVLHVVIEPADAVIDLMGLAVPPLTHTRNGRYASFVNVHWSSGSFRVASDLGGVAAARRQPGAMRYPRRMRCRS